MDGVPSKAEAIAEILRLAPLMLDAKIQHYNKETEKHEEMMFTDDHKFTIELPAWVFRTLKE